MSFMNKMKQYGLLVETWIDANFPLVELPEKKLRESMRYSLTAGGKRIRPVLSMAVCEMLGGKIEDVLPFACAIECIHTYSLIHDDLPCMDDDDLRRGKPTNHKVFGEALAVLSGDALLNVAFEIMLSEILKDPAKSYVRAKAARIISEASGGKGMIAGQVLDMEWEGKAVSFDQLAYMHQRKTGALLRASILTAVALCNGSEAITEAFNIYADQIGLAFQIKDDILDFEGKTDILGKPVGSDEKNNKTTIVTLLGLEKAKEMLKHSVESAVKAVKFMENNEFLIETAVYIAERDK